MLDKTRIEEYQNTRTALIEQVKLILTLFDGCGFVDGFDGEFEEIIKINIPRNDFDVLVVTKHRNQGEDCTKKYVFPQSYLYMPEDTLKLVRKSLIENCDRKEEAKKSKDEHRKVAYWFKAEYGLARCSACGKSVFVGWNSSKKIKMMHETYKFCPFCGAEMKSHEGLEKWVNNEDN